MGSEKARETNFEFRRLSLLTMQFIEPSEDETASVSDLKSILSDETKSNPFTDIKVLRFLRGRNHDHEKTLHGLRKHVEWRKEFEVDKLLKDTTSFTEEVEQRKVFNDGFDLKGRPVVCIIARRHNKDKRDITQVQASIIHTLEVAMHRVRQPDDKILIVFDLAQFSLSCMDYEVVKMLVNILQYNYPEILSAALIVNSPLIFSACWQIIRLWIDPVTAAKCVFIRANQLTDYIDPSEIPMEVHGVTHSVSPSKDTTPENSVGRSPSTASLSLSIEESLSSVHIAGDGSSSESVSVSKVTEISESHPYK